MTEWVKKIERDAAPLILGLPGFKKAKLGKITLIAQHASGRKYLRAELKAAPRPSIIIMVLAHSAGPPTTGGAKFNQDDTFVELGAYFAAHSIRVPEILLDQRPNLLLLEDAGDACLRAFAFREQVADMQPVIELFGDSTTEFLFRKAMDLIPGLQSCPRNDSVIFKRCMDFEVYRNEVQRFIDYYLVPHEFEKSKIQVFERAFDTLCECISAHPQVPIHRDFMPWNIHALPGGELVVLDFQDALLGSPAYDLVSLLHDRDVDYALERDLVARLLSYGQSLGLSSEFKNQYLEALLQRHFRLAGQFDLLTTKTGDAMYRGWVPGCFRRIGEVILELPYFADCLDILFETVGPFREGVNYPRSINAELSTPAARCVNVD